MAKLLRLRRGTDTQHTTFTGAEGEVTVNTTNDSLHVHDGATAGGREIRADVIKNGTSNVSVAASGDITVTRAGTTVGQFLSTGVHVNDNIKFTAGTGQDLEIYHDGSDSRIAESGTGHLIISGTQLYLNNSANTQSYFSGVNGGAASLYHAGSTKLSTTSDGIDVTGTVTCDGLTSDGDTTIRNATGRLVLRDNADSGSAAQQYISGLGADAGEDWYLGQTSSSNPDFHIVNRQGGEIQFGTNDTFRHAISSAGHWIPQTTNAYDLGSNSNQFRDAYFDGTVTTDNLTCDSSANFNHGAAGAVTIGGNGDIRLNNGNWTGDAVKIQHHNNQLYIQGGNGTYSHVFRNLNGTDRLLIDSSGHLLPGTNNAYDLGNSSLRWRNVYTNDLNLSNEGGTNDVDGTWGSWTIQEGEDDLFLLNRRNGKKYKFNLSEVN